MDKQTLLVLLENILDRIERDENTGRWRLEGVMSEKERQALVSAFETMGGELPVPPEPQPAAPPEQPAVKPPSIPESIDVGADVELDLRSIELDEPEDEEVMLCLDFGTAMSKAFAISDGEPGILDLAIGKRAGQAGSLYALSSSVYITPSGKIYFGQKAIRASLEGRTAGLKRFDSPKDMICKGVVSNLDDAPIEPEYNPTQVPLTKGDLVTLFLGYLTDMAVSELADGYNVSRYVKRRFTRPVLPPERAGWAEDELARLLARAQIIADTFHDEWEDGVDISSAARALAQIRALEESPDYLVGRPVLEPVAAINSRVRDYEPKKDARNLVMVVDVGAGTIDFAMFVEKHVTGKGVKFYEIPGSIQVLRQAGDVIDRILRRYILSKADVATTDPDYRKLDAGLSLQIRPVKEELFRVGSVEYRLENDSQGTVTLEEFLDYERVVAFGKSIQSKFLEVLESIHGSWYSNIAHGTITVYFTGGGAGLPMVRALGEQNVFVHGLPIQCRGASPVPFWVDQNVPVLANDYPQLAVAIGGAARGLPEVAPQTFDEFSGIQDVSWEMQPDYKGEDKRI